MVKSVWFCLILTATLATCAAGGEASAVVTNRGKSNVAIYCELGFPYYGVSALLSPADMAVRLREAGINATLLNEDALANPARFNSRSFAVLILPYGNTYPKKAFGNMRAFHREGGSLILSGIPFTHPVERSAGGKWTDLGHSGDPALFGPDGIGVGGFMGPASSAPPQIAPDDPLFLKPLNLEWDVESPSQRLDPSSLPAGDTLVPVVGAARDPFIAIVTHNEPPYKESVDVWACHGPTGDLEGWGTEQVLLRATLYILVHKGGMSTAQRAKALTRFDSLPKPPVYSNIALPTPARQYETLHPKMNPPARHLYVTDVHALSRDERTLLLSLQGIVNGKLPRIYYLSGDDDQAWLDEMQKQGDTDAPIQVKDPMSLINTFRKEVRGAVISDPKVYVSPCVAACLAGTDSLLMATPELARKYGLKVKIDLRGKFRDGADALKYIRTKLMDRLNPYLACSLDPAIFDTGALDQIIAAKGLVFWITGLKAQDMPGANGVGEMAEAKAILAKMPLEAVVRGFWWHGEDIGINEGPGVSLASRFGKITVVSDYVANFSVFSGVAASSFKQKTQNPAPDLDRNKVYCAFTMSDGDNLCTWRSYFKTYFNDPLHGSFPIGWGMGPSLIDCAPTWVRWYYDHATSNDEFLCDVSGVGYIYGPDWATALKDRNGAFADFYKLTEKYMHRMDMRTIRLMNVGPEDIEQAARMMPGISFLMPDYGNTGAHRYNQLTYTLPTGQSVFRAIGDSNVGAEKLVEQIKQRVGDARPAFVNVFIWNWGFKLADLKRVMELLGPDCQVVTPSQLNSLYLQSKE